MKVKVFDWELRLKRHKLIKFLLYFRYDFFNPFKKREVGTITPVFSLLPQLGIGIDRVSKYVGLHVGWLNAKFELHIYYWGYVDTSRL